MICHTYKILLIGLLFLQLAAYGDEILIDRTPMAMIFNPFKDYTLLNSVDFHPKRHLFCATYTHCNKVVLYEINAAGRTQIVQCLSNPLAVLSSPQHAAFSPDGEKLVVANWENQTIAVYCATKEGLFEEKPSNILPPPSSLPDHKPHGISFSPCGKYLAVAYGAASYHGKAVALFRFKEDNLEFELIQTMPGVELPGIPKGITFSPDGTCLLVTFSDANSIALFNLSENHEKILQPPKQVLHGDESKIYRPEDIKISANGNYCAVTNSEQNTVTFYPFNKTSNLITQITPCDILQNPEASFQFPHGITFSPDGSFLLITEFGHVQTNQEGDIIWNPLKPKEAKLNIYQLIPNARIEMKN